MNVAAPKYVNFAALKYMNFAALKYKNVAGLKYANFAALKYVKKNQTNYIEFDCVTRLRPSLSLSSPFSPHPAYAPRLTSLSLSLSSLML